MGLTSPSDVERILAALLSFGSVLGLVLLHSDCPFKPQVFFYAPGQMNVFTVPQYYPSSLQFTVSSVWVPFITMSSPLLLFSI